MTTWKLGVGLGAVLLLAASAQGADDAPRGKEDGVQRQRGSFGYRNFEARFGGADRPRARPGDAADKDGAKKPEARHRDGAGKGQQAKQKEGPSAGGQKHRKPELARDGRPDWNARWRPSTASFHGRKPGQGQQRQSFERHGDSKFGSKYAAASWRGSHRHKGHGQVGRHSQMGGHGRYAFASKHGGRHKHGGYAHTRHRGHGQMAWHGHRGHHGRQMASGRHGGHHGRYAFQQKGRHYNRYAGAWGQRGKHGKHGQFAQRGHRGHGGWQHRAVASRGQFGRGGRNAAMGRMTAMRWHHRGFAPGQFGRQGHGQHGFAMNPWMMRSKWQGFGPGQFARGPQGGQRPQGFNRPWEAPVRPAGMPGWGPQARGGAGQGDARVKELSTRLDRLQRELERLRREVR